MATSPRSCTLGRAVDTKGYNEFFGPFNNTFTAAIYAYKGTSLIRTPPPLGPYGSPVPRALW